MPIGYIDVDEFYREEPEMTEDEKRGYDKANQEWREKILSDEAIEQYALQNILDSDSGEAFARMWIWINGARWMRDFLKNEK